MPHYNVNFGDRWAMFSSIVDHFVKGFTSLEEHEDYRKANCPNARPLKKSNQMTFHEALYEVGVRHGPEEMLEVMDEAGIVDPALRRYYVDHIKECREEIDRQGSCDDFPARV